MSLSNLAQNVVDKARHVDPLLIFGGATYAKILASYLADVENIIPTALVVSDGRRETDVYTTLKGHCIRFLEISEVKRDIKSAGGALILDTVVTTKDVLRKVLEELLHDIGGGEYFDHTGRVCRDVCKQYFDAYVKHFDPRGGFDLKDEVLHFNDVSVANPYLIEECNEGLLYATLGDEVFPGAYGDCTLSAEGPYELQNVILKAGDIVIDAGANIGLFSCYAASKDCKVFAFEPDSSALKALEAQRALYPHNIEIVPKGLCDKDGSSVFYISDGGSANTSQVMVIGNKVKEVTIETVKLDSLVRDGVIPRVDFIKVDIEGAERLLLDGAREVMKKFAPKLSVCTYHLPDDPEVLERIIREANPAYKVIHQWRKLYAYVPEDGHAS